MTNKESIKRMLAIKAALSEAEKLATAAAEEGEHFMQPVFRACRLQIQTVDQRVFQLEEYDREQEAKTKAATEAADKARKADPAVGKGVVAEILKDTEESIDKQLAERKVEAPKKATKEQKAVLLAKAAGYTVDEAPPAKNPDGAAGGSTNAS